MLPLDFPTTRQGLTSWRVISPNGVSASSSWFTWNKPAGASMIYILCIGAGGGGGMATAGVRTTAPGGGGSGGISRLIIPANFLPDTLYILSGRGGAGATVAGSGTAGTTTYVSVRPTTLRQDAMILQEGGGGGGGGTTSTAGAAGNVASATAAVFMSIGVWTPVAGQAGTAGSAVSNGAVTDLVWGATGLAVSGGAGGGNGTAQGGDVTGAGFIPTAVGGTGTTGVNGQDGLGVNKLVSMMMMNNFPPIMFGGGAGGGGRNTAGASGKGGDGGYGCGGGGGGSGTNAGSTGGFGGNGGDSLTIIGAF